VFVIDIAGQDDIDGSIELPNVSEDLDTEDMEVRIFIIYLFIHYLFIYFSSSHKVGKEEKVVNCGSFEFFFFSSSCVSNFSLGFHACRS
jgi:hypothetical protein